MCTRSLLSLVNLTTPIGLWNPFFFPVDTRSISTCRGRPLPNVLGLVNFPRWWRTCVWCPGIPSAWLPRHQENPYSHLLEDCLLMSLCKPCPQLKGAAPLCTLSLEAAHIQWWVDGGWEVLSLASFPPFGVSSKDRPSSSAACHVGQGLL